MTTFGDAAVFVTDTFASPGVSAVVTLIELLPVFGSGVVEDTTAVLMYEVPDAGFVRTRVKLANAAGANELLEHDRVPEAPTAGAEHVNGVPPVCVIETNFAPAGITSDSVALTAFDGPLLMMPMV